MFATARGGVRRNELSDFVSVNQNGKIAMKFEGEDAGDRLIGVGVCSEEQDVLLATRQGRAMRFPVATCASSQSRASTGVRGIALAEGDEVISMSLVDGGKGITTEERDAYLRQSRALRQAENAAENAAETAEEEAAAGRGGGGAVDDAVAGALRGAAGQGGVRAHRRLVGLRQAHLGLRVPGDRPRRQGRRADEPRQGRRRSWRRSRCCESDQIMLVTDGGTLIRCPVDGIRIAGRATRGVRIVNVSEGERVVSAIRIGEDDAGNGNGNGNGEDHSETNGG